MATRETTLRIDDAGAHFIMFPEPYTHLKHTNLFFFFFKAVLQQHQRHVLTVWFGPMNNIYDISSTHNINGVKLLNIPFILSYIVLHDEFKSTAGDSNLPSVIRQIQKISTKVAKTLTSPSVCLTRTAHMKTAAHRTSILHLHEVQHFNKLADYLSE